MCDNRKMITRLLALVLACLTVLSIAACGGAGAEESTTTAASSDVAATGGAVASGESTTTETTAQTEAPANVDANGYLLDDIPEQDHNDKTVTVLVYKQAQNMILPMEDNAGDMIHHTVYMRNLAVEDRLGIRFDSIGENASWNDQTSFIAKATMAGENYDLIASYSLWPQVLAVQGYLTNLKDQVYPNLDQPWWCESVKEWEQNGRLYFASSNSSVMFIREAEGIFANTQMLNNYHAPDPTQLVLEGKWTLDKLGEITALFRTDLNADGVNVPYGLVVDDQSRLDMFYYGSGLNAARLDKDGKAYVCIEDEQEKLSKFVDKMINLFHQNEADIGGNSVNPMLNGQTAFMCCCLYHVTRMDDTSIYTALPVPKYDEAQEDYRTVNTNGFDVWCVPLAAKDPALSATVMEAVASEDYRSVSPFFYEQYLKLRYSNNDIGMEIYDIIRNSVYIDFGRISAVNLGVTESVFRGPIQNGTNTTISKVKAESRAWDKKMDKILEAYGY